MLTRVQQLNKTWFWLFLIQLASAIKVHKLKGLTLDRAVVNTGGKEMSLGMSYIALSPVRTPEGSAIKKHFVFQLLDLILKSSVFKDRQDSVAKMVLRFNLI